jgi:signal transduction histidine kinase
LHATPGKARLRVWEQGIGIADDDQARIFEKFERAAAVEKGSSLGLGLWLVREMVHALGGPEGSTPGSRHVSPCRRAYRPRPRSN